MLSATNLLVFMVVTCLHKGISCGMSGRCFACSRKIFTVVYLIRDEVVRLDGCNVGVDQDRGDSSFLQGFQSLRSCIMDISCQ